VGSFNEIGRADRERQMANFQRAEEEQQEVFHKRLKVADNKLKDMQDFLMICEQRLVGAREATEEAERQVKEGQEAIEGQCKTIQNMKGFYDTLNDKHSRLETAYERLQSKYDELRSRAEEAGFPVQQEPNNVMSKPEERREPWSGWKKSSWDEPEDEWGKHKFQKTGEASSSWQEAGLDTTKLHNSKSLQHALTTQLHHSNTCSCSIQSIQLNPSQSNRSNQYNPITSVPGRKHSIQSMHLQYNIECLSGNAFNPSRYCEFQSKSPFKELPWKGGWQNGWIDPQAWGNSGQTVQITNHYYNAPTLNVKMPDKPFDEMDVDYFKHKQLGAGAGEGSTM